MRPALLKTREAGCQVRTMLLVRNGVDHDARVLRAAHVVDRTLGGGTLVVGVATASAPAGETTVEGVRVMRMSTKAMPKTLRRPVGVIKPRPWLRLSIHIPNTVRLHIQDIYYCNQSRKNESKTPAPTDLHDPSISPQADTRPETPSKADTRPVAPPKPGGATEPSTPPDLTLGARARRILAGASFTWQALLLARRVRPELIQANDWNTMWCALAIKLVCGVHVVYDSHELWPDRNGRWEQRWWLLTSEALFVRVADEAMTASPGYADALAKRYRIEHPAVIRNIPNVAIATAAVPEAQAPPPVEPPLVVYVGGLMPGRGLEQMIDALALTPTAQQTIDAVALIPTVRLRAIGPGSPEYRASLMERAVARGVADRVELAPPVPPALVPGALAGATAGLCLIQPVCRSYELTLPNKLFEYAAAGLPVLASDLPVIADVVREWGIGEIVAPTDRQAIAAALARLCVPAARSAIAARTRAFAAMHTWEREAEGLRAIYERAAGIERTASLASNAADNEPAAGRAGNPADSPVFHSFS